MSPFRLVYCDFFISFVWVWSTSIIRHLAYSVLGLGSWNPLALLVKGVLAVIYLYSFSLARKATGGGSYNPPVSLCHALAGDFVGFLFTVFVRIPAQLDVLAASSKLRQGCTVPAATFHITCAAIILLLHLFLPPATMESVIGSVAAVGLISSTFPEALHETPLNVDIHHGAFTEGVLTFFMVIILLGLKKIRSESYATKTWISSICKVVLHILGYGVTGGVMNPATAFGWAYAHGKHLTGEHVYVYWLAPTESALLGVWTCSLFFKPKKRRGRRRLKQNEQLATESEDGSFFSSN